MLITIALMGVTLVLGSQQLQRFPGLLNSNFSGSVETQLQAMLPAWPVGSFRPVLSIFWQNLRAMLLGLALGIFTFGVLGLLPVMATFGIVGYFASYFSSQGISDWLFLAGFIFPHGVLEVPAAVLATAAVLQMGAILATPSPGKTIGEVWLAALADWFKILLGIVIPLLFLAAMVEAWFTARFALLLM